ncbi:hypothetical protein MGN70_002017 [Eutypa lata]|nr:hypothetical protein MGN70_002017 [Eutypa lata]
MSSPTEFPKFSKLPAELRIAIWEQSILEHNRDRLVTFYDYYDSVIFTPSLACSPHFYVTSESRGVARDLYPNRIPVLESSNPWNLRHLGVRASEAPGAVYLSTEYDIFVLNHLMVGRCPKWQPNSTPWIPRQGVKRALIFGLFDPDHFQLKDGCHNTPRCTVMRSGSKEWKYGLDHTLFSDVQEWLYVMLSKEKLDWSEMEEEHHYLLGKHHYLLEKHHYLLEKHRYLLEKHHYLLEKPGHAVLEGLRASNLIAYLDTEERERQLKGPSSECLCTEHDQGKGVKLVAYDQLERDVMAYMK